MAIAVFSAFTRAVSWTTGMVDGFFDGLKGDRAEGAPARFVKVRRAVLGCAPGAITRMLGWPATVCMETGVWYYRFDESAQQALAIQFVKGRVCGVELIG